MTPGANTVNAADTANAGGSNSSASMRSELLPLDLAERVVVFRMQGTGTIRRHVFRKLERADVDAYYSAILVATQRSGESVEDEIDVGSSELALYERAIARVEGYRLTDGRDLMEVPNWKEIVPGGHRISAADLLTKVRKSEISGEELLDADCAVISIDSYWTQNNGLMDWYRGLLHRFTYPKMAHWKKFNRVKTNSVAIGGSRAQRTVYPKLNGVLCELYDELIASVDGYSWQGNPLIDRSAIVSGMDGFHKVAAASALFDKSGSGAVLQAE